VKKSLSKIWASWTIRFNSAAMALLVAMPEIKAAIPDLQPYVDGSTYRVIGIVFVVVNIALRFKTTTSIRG